MSEDTRCPHCLGQSGFDMDCVIKAKRLQDWSGQSETGDMTIIKEKNYRCMDCRKPVRAHLKKIGVIK